MTAPRFCYPDGRTTPAGPTEHDLEFGISARSRLHSLIFSATNDVRKIKGVGSCTQSASFVNRPRSQTV
jgi:hypothetical protein